jgi:anti-anti-sigma factor
MSDHSSDRAAHGIPSGSARSASTFRIDVVRDAPEAHVIPAGELDLRTVAQLREQLDELLNAGFTRLVIDLRKLEFMDSSGLSLLLNTHRAAQQEGWQLSLIQGGHAVRRVFEITGLLDRLPFEPASTSRASGGG